MESFTTRLPSSRRDVVTAAERLAGLDAQRKRAQRIGELLGDILGGIFLMVFFAILYTITGAI